MSDFDIDEVAPPKPVDPPKPRQAVQAAPETNGHLPPDAELYLLSCCLVEPERMLDMGHIPHTAFVNKEAAPIWQALRDKLDPLDYEAFSKKTKGPFRRLLEIRNLSGLGTGFSGWLREFDDGWRTAEFQRIALEMSKTENPDPRVWARKLETLDTKAVRAEAKGLFTFGIPAANDKSVLLGDRYLNRGDGAILSCSSGMGKSSMARQMATMWACGRAFMGIKPNGKLRSLEIQAEDSDGDIGEVALSIAHMEKFTEAEKTEINANVVIVTERVRRGPDFIDELRRLIRKHKPDLVWINPLQSFIEGDITEARDLSLFLHEGLNALNADQSFAFIIVHHTTKPPKGDQKKAGLSWNEIMYDMAGGALLINWARAIISLRPAEEKGEFNLILSKRGTRADVTRKVEQGAGFREEIITDIPLRWSKDLIEIPGREKRLRAIYWEPRSPDPADKGDKGGRPRKHNFQKFSVVFPIDPAKAISPTRSPCKALTRSCAANLARSRTS